MSTPRSSVGDLAAKHYREVFARHYRTPDALAELSNIVGEHLNAGKLRSFLVVRGIYPRFPELLAKAPREHVRSAYESPRVEVHQTFPQPPPPPPPVDPLDAHRDRKGAAHFKAQASQLLDRLHEAEERQKFLDALDGFSSAPRIFRREKASGMREATAVGMGSDWHVEERIFPESVSGRNSYNLEIAEARLVRLFRGFRWLIDHGRHSFKIRDAIFWLGGDLMTGYIHPELEESNEIAPLETIIWLQQRIVQGIEYLLEDPQLETLTIPCSYGNHGRMHQKKRIKTGAQNSFEWLLYVWLSQHFAGNKRVRFVVDKSPHQYVEAYDWTLHFHHGDELNYGGGVGGVTIPINKRVPKWDRVRPAHFHHIGHFHQYMDLGRVTVNGSLIGYSDYAMSIGADYEPPQQAFYLLDPSRGKTMCSPIWVDEAAPRIEAA